MMIMIPSPHWHCMQRTSGFSTGHVRPASVLPFAFYKDSAPRTSIFSSLGIPGLVSGGEYQLDPMSMACNCQWLDLPSMPGDGLSVSSQVFFGFPFLNRRSIGLRGTLQPKALLFQQTASRKLQKQTNVFPGKFAFRISAGGQLYEGFFATILARVPKNPNASSGDRITDFLKKGTAFMGAMYGIGGPDTSNWGRAFDALILSHSSGSAASSCEAVFDRFLKELKYGPLYFALQDEELQRVRQVQLQGAMTRQQNAIRASQNLSRTTFRDLRHRQSGLPGSQPTDGSHLRPLPPMVSVVWKIIGIPMETPIRQM